MGRVALHGRENWQTESGPRGKSGTAEKDLIEALKRNLDPETTKSMLIPKISNISMKPSSFPQRPYLKFSILMPLL